MRVFQIILSLTLLIASFGYGIGVGKYNWFPIEELRLIKIVLYNAVSNEVHSATEIELANVSNRLLPDDALKLRKMLLKSIVPTNKIDVHIKSKANFEVFETTYYGVTIKGEFYRALEHRNCLRVYLQGHGGNPNNFAYYNQLREMFLNDGCDVLSLSMLGLGLNEGSTSFPSQFGVLNLSPIQASNHGNYSFFFDKTNPELDPLSLFLYPHMRLINNALELVQYKDVAVLGISGGGWYTVWLAALMPELKLSLSYAGSLPLAYRIDRKHHGDWEQVYSQLYNSVTYLELYKLMLIDNRGNPTRKAYLVYNDKDPCCFSSPAASDFRTHVDKLDFYPKVLIDNSYKHSMNVSIVQLILGHE